LDDNKGVDGRSERIVEQHMVTSIVTGRGESAIQTGNDDLLIS
jgi:hypothetical protein